MIRKLKYKWQPSFHGFILSFLSVNPIIPIPNLLQLIFRQNELGTFPWDFSMLWQPTNINCTFFDESAGWVTMILAESTISESTRLCSHRVGTQLNWHMLNRYYLYRRDPIQRTVLWTDFSEKNIFAIVVWTKENLWKKKHVKWIL